VFPSEKKNQHVIVTHNYVQKGWQRNMMNFGLYFRNQVSRYVLFLVGRVGSTYLTSLLNSHPNILALQEELADLQEQGAKAQMEWSRGFLTPPLIGRKGVRGFTVKVIQLVDPDSFTQLLYEKQCHIIHLERRNRVKAVVSYLNGRRLHEKTGMWGLFDDANRPSSFIIDPVEFEELLKNRETRDRETEDFVGNLRLPTLRLYYEDMLQDEDAFLEQIFSFLDIPPKPLEGRTLKITSDDLRKVIDNFDQVRTNYVGTQYESMFDEVLIP
jgi:LPS sulfotransferase NodH